MLTNHAGEKKLYIQNWLKNKIKDLLLLLAFRPSFSSQTNYPRPLLTPATELGPPWLEQPSKLQGKAKFLLTAGPQCPIPYKLKFVHLLLLQQICFKYGLVLWAILKWMTYVPLLSSSLCFEALTTVGMRCLRSWKWITYFFITGVANWNQGKFVYFFSSMEKILLMTSNKYRYF